MSVKPQKTERLWIVNKGYNSREEVNNSYRFISIYTSSSEKIEDGRFEYRLVRQIFIL